MEKKKVIIYLVVLVAIIVVISVSFGFFDKITGNVVAEKGLVAHYSFEENVKDITGNGYDAVDFPYMVKYGYGRAGKALDFNREGGYVLIGDKEGLDLQEFTLSFWSKLNDPSAIYQGGIGKGILFGHPEEFSYVMEFSAGKIKAAITTPVNREFEIKTPVGDNSWHFWLMSVGNGKLALYKDGVVQGLIDYDGKIDYVKRKNDLVVGTSREIQYLFNGKIDEFKIWNYALTEENVWDEYNSYSNENYCGNGVCDIVNENEESCAEDCSCKDSDKGINYYEKGTCEDNKGRVIVDNCGGDDWLNEAYCDDSGTEVRCKFSSQSCSYGCSDGVCLGHA